MTNRIKAKILITIIIPNLATFVKSKVIRSCFVEKKQNSQSSNRGNQNNNPIHNLNDQTETEIVVQSVSEIENNSITNLVELQL